MLKKFFVGVICHSDRNEMKRRISRCFAMLSMTLVMASVIYVNLSSAKDLSKKTGIGFNSQLSGFGVDSLSVRWWFSKNKKMAAEGLLGFSLGDDTVFNVGGKFLTVIKEEPNLNIYGFGIAGIESYDFDKGDSYTALTLGGGFGTEFFFSDFPNLGFGAEVGLNFTDINKTSQFGTSAGWLSAVGIRYYL